MTHHRETVVSRRRTEGGSGVGRQEMGRYRAKRGKNRKNSERSERKEEENWGLLRGQVQQVSTGEDGWMLRATRVGKGREVTLL